MNTNSTTPPGRPVRVRLAPSPTGFVHIGNALIALINAAFVSQHESRDAGFVIRIEDTDQKRFVQEAEDLIYDSLRWLGITWNEAPDKGGPYGPYRQSERLPTYQSVAHELVAQGCAYFCWCSPERLDQMRREQQARKQPPKYDRLCLGKTEEQRKRLGGYSERPVVRFRMPDSGQTSFVDLVRGDLTFENALLDDRVLVKSDGYPSGPFAIPVDDHLMRISHVIRGEEWLSSTPLYVQIYQALGWDLPVFAHVPLLLNPDRAKISKRKHPWAYMAWFREQGYLPEAVVNYLGNLAVLVPDPENPDASVRRELFGFAEIARYLDLAKIGPSGKILDLERLDWLNGQYIRRMTVDELVDRVRPFMEAAGLNVTGDPRFPAALALEHERIKRLSEVPQVVSLFFRDEPYDPTLLLPRGLEPGRAVAYLEAAGEVVDRATGDPTRWAPAWLEAEFRDLSERFGLQTGRERGQFFMVVRVAVTGRSATPPLFDTMVVLGLDIVKRRVEAALRTLAADPSAVAGHT